MLPMMAGPAAGEAISGIAGAMSGGPATSGSNQDTASHFGTGGKTINFGPPPSRNNALQNPFVIGGIVFAVGLVAVVWLKAKK